MPVDGRVVEQVAAKRSVPADDLAKQIHEHGDAPEKMQRVHTGEDVEEGTVGIGGQVESLGRELPPSEILAGDEG